MIKDIKELNFPTYATLSTAEVTLADMGEKTISTQVKIDGSVTPDFTFDWAVEYKGEKYIMPLRQPQGSKDNTSLDATIDLTFTHWAVYQLKRWFFSTMEYVDAGTAVADKYEASVTLNLGDFCALFQRVLSYHYGECIALDLNPEYVYEQDAKNVEISRSYIWDVLLQLHDIYGVRWSIEAAENNVSTQAGGERYVIRVGYNATEVSHIFEYGFEGGLMKVERQVQSDNIRNMLAGRGGSDNLPRYYYKEVPEAEAEQYHQDPDWIPELANIYFDVLRGATFRSYVQGWKQAHYDGEDKRATTYAQWAYDKGLTDTAFNPPEYVKDDDSIKQYGELFGMLEDNEDYYPTIQLSGKNIAVDVEQILSDEVGESAENSAKYTSVFGAKVTAENVPASEYVDVRIDGEEFDVPEGKTANFYDETQILRVVRSDDMKLLATTSSSANIAEYAEISITSVDIYDLSGDKHSAVGLSGGRYRYVINVQVHNLTTDGAINVEIGTVHPKLLIADAEQDWRSVFNVWIPDIWGIEKYEDETEEEFAERTWRKILGDAEGNEAKVMFTSGALAVSEDYEFIITKIPEYDTSKEYDGVQSMWKLTLGKSDADFEALGVYVPNTQRQGAAGDKFVFIGIEPTQEYVEWAERALEDYKTDELNKVKDVQPTWAVSVDRVRVHNNGEAGALVEQLQVGNSIRIADSRFITTINESGEVVPSSAETLFIQQIKYTYRAASDTDAALNPDIDLTLSNDYSTSGSTVQTLQGEVSALQKQIGSLSSIEKIVRAIGDKLYLRKDGLSDRSYSPTQFTTLVTSADFRSGIIGGRGWGIYQDANGAWVYETDKINVREEMQVTTLVINEAEARGGMIVDTAAAIKVTNVIYGEDKRYYCYFDQKGGSVHNHFKVDDVAYSQRWKADNSELKFYKRRVVEVGLNYIALADTQESLTWTDSGVNGSGIPEIDDTIIHFGNYKDKTRQYVKVRDVVGGGYERFLDGLDSVFADGEEYYFAGKQDGEYGGKVRFFIGNKAAQYIEFLEDKLNIKATLNVESTVEKDGEETPLEEFIDAKINEGVQGVDYLREALQQNTTISGGLVLTSTIGVGEQDADGVYTLKAGVNGIYDADHENGGVAFWGGGTLTEAAAGASTFVIYADGTGHAAGGTIKFKPSKLQVGEYVNLSDDGLDMTINGSRKMQMGNYSIEPSVIMNHRVAFSIAEQFIDGAVAYRYSDSYSPNYGLWVEGLGYKDSSPLSKDFEIGAAVKGSTVAFSNALMTIDTAVNTSVFSVVNSTAVPRVLVELYDGNDLVRSFGTLVPRFGYTQTNADGSTVTSDPENIHYDLRSLSHVLTKDCANLTLRVTMYNSLDEPTGSDLDKFVKLGDSSSGTSAINITLGGYVTCAVPEYNQTTIGANGLQVSWGNCHQYQRDNYWGVRVGTQGLRINDGDVYIYTTCSEFNNGYGMWVSLAQWVKAIIAEYNEANGIG